MLLIARTMLRYAGTSSSFVRILYGVRLKMSCGRMPTPSPLSTIDMMEKSSHVVKCTFGVKPQRRNISETSEFSPFSSSIKGPSHSAAMGNFSQSASG